MVGTSTSLTSTSTLARALPSYRQPASTRSLTLAAQHSACPRRSTYTNRIVATSDASNPRATLSPLFSHISQRSFSSSSSHLSSSGPTPVSAIRNISAWGHIDAGKTTLTERLLYHTGGSESSPESSIQSQSLPGDVDDGSTVTDFLEEERERGITIQSAAVGPLWWKSPATQQSGAITLIDTPGHIDFTIEVERALRVADGCIVVLDSVEGVEAQTETNWRIGKRYGVRSNILFLNKLDRMGASVTKSLKSFVQKGLHPRPVLLQLPVYARGEGAADEGKVEGVIDLLEMKQIGFEGRAGEQMITGEIAEPSLMEEATRARHALVENIASLDEQLMEELFSFDGDSPHAKITASSLRASIRRLTIAGKIVPAFCGSAAKNIGVQPLLDGVVDFLPSPNQAGDVRDEAGMGNGTVEGTNATLRTSSRKSGKGAKKKALATRTPPSRSDARKRGTAAAAQDGPRGQEEDSTSDEGHLTTFVSIDSSVLTALAFKVVHDKRRGPLTFVRIYSGHLTRSTTLFNTSTQTKERISRILLPFGGTYNEVDSLGPGQVGVVLGFRDTKTGDTLVGSSGKDKEDLQSLRLRSVDVPPPVFSVSVEPYSKSDEDSVNEALAMLVRTDPSLRLDGGEHGTSGEEGFASAGTDTQMILSGMGELHLEIASDRLKNEFGVKARIGGVRVSYRETLTGNGSEGRLEEWKTVEEVVERDMGGKKVMVGAKIRVRSIPEGLEGDESLGGNLINIDLAQGGGDEDVLGTFESKSALKRKEKESAKRKGSHPSNRSGAALEEQGEKEASSSGLSPQAVHNQILSGLTAALSRGPLSSHPLTNLQVHLSSLQTFSPELSPPKAISAIVASLLRKALGAKSGPKVGGQVRLMEPVMKVRIEVKEGFLGRVISDITSEQGGEVLDVFHPGEGETAFSSLDEASTVDIYLPPEDQVFSSSSSSSSTSTSTRPSPPANQKITIHARIPLSKLVSYSSRLRALTAGMGTYTMGLEGFRVVNEDRQREILSELGRI